MNANTIARSRALFFAAEQVRSATRKLVAQHGASMVTAMLDNASDTITHVAKNVVSRKVWEEIVVETQRSMEQYEAAIAGFRRDV